MYVISNLLTSRKQEKKALYALLLPAFCRKLNSQTGWKRSRRGGEFCVSEFGMRQVTGLCAKEVLAAIIAVPNGGLEQESDCIYF